MDQFVILAIKGSDIKVFGTMRGKVFNRSDKATKVMERMQKKYGKSISLYTVPIHQSPMVSFPPKIKNVEVEAKVDNNGIS